VPRRLKTERIVDRGVSLDDVERWAIASVLSEPRVVAPGACAGFSDDASGPDRYPGHRKVLCARGIRRS